LYSSNANTSLFNFYTLLFIMVITSVNGMNCLVLIWLLVQKDFFIQIFADLISFLFALVKTRVDSTNVAYY